MTILSMTSATSEESTKEVESRLQKASLFIREQLVNDIESKISEYVEHIPGLPDDLVERYFCLLVHFLTTQIVNSEVIFGSILIESLKNLPPKVKNVLKTMFDSWNWDNIDVPSQWGEKYVFAMRIIVMTIDHF